MKNFTALLLLLTLTFCQAAFAKIQNEDVKSYSDIQRSVLSTTGNLASGSACIASPGSTTGLIVGQFIYDQTTSANIPAATTIAGLPGTCTAGQIQMSANAAGTATGDTITFGGQLSQLINSTKLYSPLLGESLESGITDGTIAGNATQLLNLSGALQTPTLVQFANQGSTPSTPVSGKSKVYIKSADNKLYILNSSGVETPVGSTTSPLTTKGDIWGFSSVDARLPVGSNGQEVVGDSTATLGVSYKTPSDTGVTANLLSGLNPGFEFGTGSWTASGGTLTQDSTAGNIGVGSFSGAWTPGASSQTLTSGSVTVKPGMYGQPGQASIRIKTSGTLHKFQVFDSTTSAVLSDSGTITGTGSYQQILLNNWAFPSAGDSLVVRVLSGDTTAMNVDDAYLGPQNGSSQVTQAQLVGGVVITGCASTFSTTATSMGALSTNSGCTYTTFGSALAPSTQVAGLKFASLGSGEYKLEYEGNIGTAITGQGAYFQFTDGTNNARETSYFVGNSSSFTASGISQSISYTSSQSNVTLQIFGKADATGTAFLRGSTANPGVIRVWKFPSQNQLVTTPNTTPQYWSGYVSACATTPTLTSASIADFNLPASCALTSLQSVNMAPSLGSTATSVNFTPNAIGDFLVVANTFGYNNTNTTLTRMYLTDGSNNVLSSEMGGGNSSTDQKPFAITGLLHVADLTQKTVKLRGTAGSGNVFNLGTDDNGRYVTWSIIDLSHGFNMPYAVNTVSDSNSTTQSRIEIAAIGGAANSDTACSSGTCTIWSQAGGSWLNSVAWAGAGLYTVNFASSMWSSPPVCTCSARDPSNGSLHCMPRFSTSTTSSISVYTQNPTGTGINSVFSIECKGQR
jgi:hypothetical protein